MFCFNSSKEAFCLNAAFHTLLASFYILLKYNPEIIKDSHSCIKTVNL